MVHAIKLSHIQNAFTSLHLLISHMQHRVITIRYFSIFCSDKFMKKSKAKRGQMRFSEGGIHTVCKILSILN